MRLLLIAYEFPPSPSPQSLRWAYLSRELHRLGHEVHVLTIDLGGDHPGLPELPADIRLHRTHPGPVRGVFAWRRRRRLARNASPSEATSGKSAAEIAAAPPSRGGWKHRLSLLIQRSAEYVCFPDLRGEWIYSARRRLRTLLPEVQPDVVITSHEPATTLQLGLLVKDAGYRWIADLGDPVLAPYTPARWQQRAHQLEAAVWRLSDHVTLTSMSAQAVLTKRHGARRECTLLTQGFDHRVEQRLDAPVVSGTAPLELLYTGSFYSFRRSDSLLRAVLDVPGIRLNVASINVPQALVQASREHPDRFRLLGFLPHLDALQWQRHAHILVNISNADPMQVPGKFYEYLGSGRPILHLANEDDEAGAIVKEFRRGWVCSQDEAALRDRLAHLVESHRAAMLTDDLDLSLSPVARHSWEHLGIALDNIVQQVGSRT